MNRWRQVDEFPSPGTVRSELLRHIGRTNWLGLRAAPTQDNTISVAEEQVCCKILIRDPQNPAAARTAIW